MTAFDERLDEAFERLLRNRRTPDMVMYAASALGDHGLLWLLLAGAQAGRRRHANWRRPLIRAAAGLGLESALVNGPVKWVFRRSRPIHDGPRPMHLRQPRTSSFPSGHATAAFFAASLLGEGDPLQPLYYALAVIVAASRLHVKIHHASDVVGGAIIGAVLGEIVRRAVPLEAAAPAGPAREESPAS
ncbi:MAG: phosphatase PAP2 family protein [Actinomycetota bacterium]|nr:phosphatase PAP2 family protein [Actinomycetota bacterium]